MPSLGSHMARARAVADRLRLSEIDADRGAYYLGSTAPDIRVITRNDREVTHFFTLAELEQQDSVARMFREHPELASPTGLDAAVTAFIAGPPSPQPKSMGIMPSEKTSESRRESVMGVPKNRRAKIDTEA